MATKDQEPVAVIKVWKHPIDGNHIDISTYKEILDLPEGEYDLFTHPAPDKTEALVAAAYRAAADVCEKSDRYRGDYFADKCRALTPADAEKALREICLEVAEEAGYWFIADGSTYEENKKKLEAIVNEILKGKTK